ncbi:MAG TPA: efflux transporter outer membrane subunit [Burkholderiales bacterium]|jgi:multidrug efflux system outer membrane protein|nr:efflux transporter outer membrane subunit [Burkholderiales bacterium]
MRATVLSVAVACALAGCMMGPDYKRPDVDTPQAYRVEVKSAADLINSAWWEQFEDPVLNELIKTALAENKDVRIAASRVEEFLGRYGVTRSQLFPQVATQFGAGSQRISTVTQPAVASTQSNTFDSFSLDLGMSWEIDLWGKLRRATEAARAELLATEQARQTVILSLTSGVATSYVTLIDLDRQLAIAKSTADSRGEFFRIIKLRFEGGVVSEVELNQARSDYEFALSTVPVIEKQIAQQENALSVLLGRNPGPIARDRTLDKLVLPQVPADLPSSLLERRPDIRQSEQLMVAANARIGVAKAQFFPTISLTAILGTASSALGNLFKGASQTWSYGGTVTQPIFTGGNLISQLRVAESQQKTALLQYQRSIQTAFQEVNDSLIDQTKTREQLAAQARQVDSLRNYARLARLRYDNGFTSYLEVTDAETKLFNAELQYAQSQGQLFFALINVYKSMGGGWVVEADRMTDAAGMEKTLP